MIPHEALQILIRLSEGHVGFCNNFIRLVPARTIYVKQIRMAIWTELGSSPNRHIVLLSKLFSSSVGELPKGPHFTYSLGPQSLSLSARFIMNLPLSLPALCQSGAQLTKVPLFEVLKFRWGSTSST